MSDPTAPVPVNKDKPPFAWQPLTPRGIAAFASVRNGRVWLVQFIMALFVAATAVWLVRAIWFPVVVRAIEHLPPKGEIRGGQLHWQAPAPVSLADSRFLAFSVDPDHSGNARSPAHIYIEFGRTNLRVYSLLGYIPLNYPPGYIIEFGRGQLAPWWGAWSPVLLALLVLGIIGGLLVSWALLGVLYAGPAWLIAFYANRRATLIECWRVAGAALMIPALFVCATGILYVLGALDLVMVAILFGAHFVIGWIYLWLSVLQLPLLPEAAIIKSNPFVPPTTPAVAAAPAPAADNPETPRETPPEKPL